MPWVEFEPTITASERAKTVPVLDRAATVTGSERILAYQNLLRKLVSWLVWWLWGFGHVVTFSLSPRYLSLSIGSNPRWVHVGFVVDKLSLKQKFLQALPFPPVSCHSTNIPYSSHSRLLKWPVWSCHTSLPQLQIRTLLTGNWLIENIVIKRVKCWCLIVSFNWYTLPTSIQCRCQEHVDQYINCSYVFMA
jgi:hypothetical protein